MPPQQLGMWRMSLRSRLRHEGETQRKRAASRGWTRSIVRRYAVSSLFPPCAIAAPGACFAAIARRSLGLSAEAAVKASGTSARILLRRGSLGLFAALWKTSVRIAGGGTGG